KLNKMMIDPAAPKELAVALEERYQEIRYLPKEKSNDVKTAPHTTSRKRTLASGKKAKIQANKVVMMNKDTPVLMRSIICRLMLGIYSPKKSPTLPIKRLMILLKTNETMSRNPSPIIIEKDSKRSITILSQPFFGLTLICQISLIEFCMSTKIVVDEKISVPIPI